MIPALVASLALATSPSPKLPLKSLVLYENGLGYYERSGVLPSGAVVDLPLEPGQLDDALKSMVVLSQTRLASVAFAPPLAAEAARSLAGLPSPEEQRSLESLVRALKGVEVEVRREEGPALVGRVVEVTQDEERDLKGNPVPAPGLLLFGESGLHRLKLSELASVRPLDGSVRLAWQRAAASTSRKPERQALQVRAGQGGGSVALGYTTEAPVWRTTYRLVLGKGASRLQGFALVHNDSDETWNGVKVTLASGRPASFVFPLAGPRYGRRELVSPEDGLETAPQLATEEVQEHLRGPLESVGVGSIGTVGYGSGGGGYGSGSGALVSGRSGRTEATVQPSTLLADGPSPLEPAATSEAGDLFLYTVKEPVVLPARQSALLPIIDARATAERVTVIDGSGRAQLAVRLKNDTGVTLEGGTVSIFTDGAYAGEAQVDRFKPDEVRVVRHGDDLDLEVARRDRREPGPTRLVQRDARTGAVKLHRVDRIVHPLTFTSRSERPRAVLVELPHAGFRVTAGGDEDVRSPGQPRFARLALGAHEAKELELVEEGAFVETVQPEQLTTARLDALLADPIGPEVRKQLAALREQAALVEKVEQRRKDVEAGFAELEKEVARVREDLSAAGKGGATQVAQTLGQRLLGLEEKLTALREEKASLGKQAVAARAALVASR